MLTERDIGNLLEKGDSDAVTWNRWHDQPIPRARCWLSTDWKWLIQYIPDQTDPSVSIARLTDEGQVLTYVPSVTDRAASKLLRAAAIDPRAMMETLQEVETAETHQFIIPDGFIR